LNQQGFGNTGSIVLAWVSRVFSDIFEPLEKAFQDKGLKLKKKRAGKFH